MFHKESLSGFHDFKQKVVVELTAGVNEAKILPKIANIPMHKQPNTNTNTPPLVSLDNSSTLTISNIFVAHSSFYPIDTKNELKLFFLLSLCSFSAAFGVVEDDILAF